LLEGVLSAAALVADEILWRYNVGVQVGSTQRILVFVRHEAVKGGLRPRDAAPHALMVDLLSNCTLYRRTSLLVTSMADDLTSCVLVSLEEIRFDEAVFIIILRSGCHPKNARVELGRGHFRGPLSYFYGMLWHPDVLVVHTASGRVLRVVLKLSLTLTRRSRPVGSPLSSLFGSSFDI